ncbi:hypothetical protein [Halomarina ordinaria]|uniref:DUF4263 domain-containing protein n=1 Tax=Halomarina ordinaria TaxID=3033939 RepID=A0ABD5UDD5_9EURY|nr:hypothetical protein [Halomarina sp. PSRA2]
MVNVDPPEDLPDHWTTDFRSYYRGCIRDKYRNFNEETYTERLRDNISDEKEHRKLLNLCVFPFTTRAPPAGYKFLRADPLEELGVPNFDFLLWDFEGQAVFGEAKSSIGKGAKSLVNEVEKQRETVEEHRDYIVEHYLGEEPRNIEYVLATFASDANDITEKVIETGVEVVTWGVHQMRKRVSVNSILPDQLPEGEDLEDTRLRIQHSNHSLNSALKKADTSTGGFNVFPESHPVTQLRTIISSRSKHSGHCYVDKETIHSTIDEDLFYVSEDVCEEIIANIIQMAQTINFLRREPDGPADFKIVSRYTNSRGLEKTLEQKWCQYQVQQKREQMQEECYEQATEEVDQQKELSEYY